MSTPDFARTMLSPESNLNDLPDRIWQRLGDAADRPADPFSCGVLSTVSGGLPRSRILILRGVRESERRLLMHTDVRSLKLRNIARQPRVEWLFYDHASRFQLRMQGVASVHIDDELADGMWNRARPETQRIFLAPAAPGSPCDPPSSCTPAANADVTRGRTHFAVLCTEVLSLDLLQIRPDGNLRAEFVWQDGGWTGRWVTA